eukprot:TRINITY_DN55477_c0_g1_i1.p1 TRINITY_DN55477_c0_g1~~TRINITY_DN55477_c0_g1_i1.p1  ORF type:complete len:935 (-),score=56.18 TRINITY_DN55477_c0_g1_i1:28-2811(-)
MGDPAKPMLALMGVKTLSQDPSAKPAIETLVRILQNIAKSPDEPKYRKLNTQGNVFKTKIHPHVHVVALLQQLGFTHEGDDFICHKPNAKLIQEVLVAVQSWATPELPAFEWKKYEKKVPAFAVQGGNEGDGRPLYVARAYYEGGLQLGKANDNSPGCHIPYGGREVYVPECEVLTCRRLPANSKLLWVKAAAKGVPDGAVEGGKEYPGGQLLYVGRAQHPQGGIHCGKVGAHLQTGMSFSWGGQELNVSSYEVLVLAKGTQQGTAATIEGDMTRPCSMPLHSMQEILDWLPGADECNVSTVPLRPKCWKWRPGSKPKNPDHKMLVCHDFRGGYTESDKYPQGGDSSDVYRFRYWQWCDIFVYFSHHRVTIPPPCWINVAHRHGTKMLGTLITEGDQGIQECQQFLSSNFACESVAHQLISIAQYYGFDGWLINIENPIHPSMMETLVTFLITLTTGMHSAIEGSQVIWYDSVVHGSGRIMYQNMLNENNKQFFDITDGLFTNYWWEKDFPFASAALAGERQWDVYTGIDVFGRRTYGGGGWTCNAAMEVIAEAKTSTALFAPGWTYEAFPGRFEENDTEFWNKLQPFFADREFVAPSLPFRTTYNKGCGKRRYLNGEMVSSQPWCNFSEQDVLIMPHRLRGTPGCDITSFLDDTYSYCGASCMGFKGHILHENTFAMHQLLKVRTDCTTSQKPKSITVNIAIHRETPDQDDVTLMAIISSQKGNTAEGIFMHCSEKIPSECSSLPQQQCTPTLINHVHAWTEYTFQIKTTEKSPHLASLSVICGSVVGFVKSQLGDAQTPVAVDKRAYCVRIGEIRIFEEEPCDEQQLAIKDVAIRDVVASELTKSSSFTLTWSPQLKKQEAAIFNVFVDEKFVGCSFVPQFRLVDFPNASLKEKACHVKIQTVNNCGDKLPLEKLSEVQVKVPSV